MNGSFREKVSSAENQSRVRLMDFCFPFREKQDTSGRLKASYQVFSDFDFSS